MRRITRPVAGRCVHFDDQKPVGGKFRPEDLIDLPCCVRPTPYFDFHFARRYKLRVMIFRRLRVAEGKVAVCLGGHLVMRGDGHKEHLRPHKIDIRASPNSVSDSTGRILPETDADYYPL